MTELEKNSHIQPLKLFPDQPELSVLSAECSNKNNYIKRFTGFKHCNDCYRCSNGTCSAPSITVTNVSYIVWFRFQALRSRRNTSDDLLGMAAKQRAAKPKFQRMNSVMGFGIKEDLGLPSTPPPVSSFKVRSILR